MYVEYYDGLRWGWYEGQSLTQLLDWLRQGGGIEREAALIKCLATVPIPKKPASRE